MRVRPLEARDAAAWRRLFNGYIAFYAASVPEHVIDATWRRLMAGGEGAQVALVAVDDADEPFGLAHVVFHRSTWSATWYCYLEDLFVDPARRKEGAGRALIEAVYREADARREGVILEPGEEHSFCSARQTARGETVPPQPVPDIVVTNYSMLEYMLCRPQDQVFFGRGLRCVVLDEAHLYAGTLAAEITLLLRRLYDRCGLRPADVMQIATSATLGGNDDQLRLFAATIFSRTSLSNASAEESSGLGCSVSTLMKMWYAWILVPSNSSRFF